MIKSFDDLIDFLHQFYAPWGKHNPSDNIPEDLPRPLARIYHEFGSLIDLETPVERLPFATQDILVPVQYLKKVGNMYEFAWENQGNWSCRTKAKANNPQVYSNARDVWERPARGFQLICHSLEHFLTTFCLQEAVMGCPNLIVTNQKNLESIFNSKLKPLWLNGIYVDGEISHHFYQCDRSRSLILQLKYGDIWVGSYKDDIRNHLNCD